MEDKGRLMEELRNRLLDLEPLPGEEEFITSTETLMRFLKARDWKLKDAEKLLRATVEWRRKTSPQTLQCTTCHAKPGTHSIRQVGHDEMGRPVIYTCFAQSAVTKNTVEDTVTHSTYLVENAKRTMPLGVHTWVMIIDCTGITLPACNPKLGYGSTQVLSNFYPERLGLVICLNHNALFQGVWKAIKVFLHPNTVAKMKLVRSKKKIRELFERTFPDELTRWLLDEIQMNKRSPMPPGQKRFWLAPETHGEHDPRGCPSYVSQYVDSYRHEPSDLRQHRPHPNIVEALRGDSGSPTTTPTAGSQAGVPTATATTATLDSDTGQASNNTDDNNVDSDDEVTQDEDVEIDEEFQIPRDAQPLQM